MNEQHDRSLITAIRKMAGTDGVDQVYLVTGKVESVDEAAGTCVVDAISGNATTQIIDVEFQAVVSDGLLIIPRVGSEVKVLFSKFTDPFIVQYSEVEKIYLSADLTQFEDGALGGMVKVIPLTKKLNDIENDINNLKTIFSSWVPVPNDGGAALKLASASWYSQQIIPTKQSEIENTKIVQ